MRPDRSSGLSPRNELRMCETTSRECRTSLTSVYVIQNSFNCRQWHTDGLVTPQTYIICFHYWCSVYGICKWSDTLWPVGHVRLFADYTNSLSSLCRLMWKHWTTKMLVRYMMPSVCLRLRQFSQLSLYSLYGAVCLQLTQFCDDRENVYFILLSSSNRKYESLTIV